MANNAWHYLYGRRWQRARLVHLRKQPLCVRCAERGITEAATVVDHIKRHMGDLTLFWDRKNWQSLCFRCHNSDKQSEEWLDENAPAMRALDGYPPEGDW